MKLPVELPKSLRKSTAKKTSRKSAKKAPQAWSDRLPAVVAENKLTVIAIVLFLIAVPFAVLSGEDQKSDKGNNAEQVQAQDQTEQTEQKESEPKEEEKSEPEAQNDTNTYAYVTQPEDTYSQMARKAIQTYGINNNVNLSQAQILFAETNLTLQAGSPQLEVGDEVSLEESVVKDWVEKAQKLTESQEQAWQAYNVGVDFNTDSVGEAR